MTFGERLRNARKNKGYEAQFVAKKINVAKSTYSGYENDKTKPSFDILQNLSKLLNVSVDYLLDTETSQSSFEPSLTKKDEKDIAKDLENTLNRLETSQDGLMFDGEALDDETRELLKISLENSMRLAKQIAKKYTPKKYRK